jgi:hypothetical protein
VNSVRRMVTVAFAEAAASYSFLGVLSILNLKRVIASVCCAFRATPDRRQREGLIDQNKNQPHQLFRGDTRPTPFIHFPPSYCRGQCRQTSRLGIQSCVQAKVNPPPL